MIVNLANDGRKNMIKENLCIKYIAIKVCIAACEGLEPESEAGRVVISKWGSKLLPRMFVPYIFYRNFYLKSHILLVV